MAGARPAASHQRPTHSDTLTSFTEEGAVAPSAYRWHKDKEGVRYRDMCVSRTRDSVYARLLFHSDGYTVWRGVSNSVLPLSLLELAAIIGTAVGTGVSAGVATVLVGTLVHLQDG